MVHTKAKLFLAIVVAALMIPAAGYAVDLVSDDGEVIAAWELKGLAAEADAIESAPNRGIGGVARLSEVESEAVTEAMPFSEMLKLKVANAPVGIETVLGFDGRVQTRPSTFPWRAVTLITFSGGRCTGFLVGDDVVVTSGHCVHSGGSRGNWYRNHTILPGRGGGSFGRCRAVRLFTNSDWINRRADDRDWGIIKTTRNCARRTGYFGFLTGVRNGEPVKITGYPGDKPLTQWQSSDRIRALQTRRIYYKADTLGGMSGSPIWHDYFLLRYNGPYAAGVHSYGTYGSGLNRNYNHGARFDSFFFNSVISVKRQ